MAEELATYDQVETGDPDPLGLEKKLAQIKSKGDPLGLEAKLRAQKSTQQPKQEQPAFQIQISEPTFRATPRNIITQPANPSESINIKKDEISYIPDEKTYEIHKQAGKARIAHEKVNVALVSNDAQYEKKLRENRRDSYTIESLRNEYKQKGQILSPQDEQRLLQKEKERQFNLPVSSENITDFKTGTILNPNLSRKFVKDLNDKEISESAYQVDKFNEIANDPDPYAHKRIEKINENSKAIKKGTLIYDPESKTLIKPLGLVGSIIEGTKNKFKADEEHDFLKNTDNDAAIISELEDERNNPKLDEPIKVPRGKASEILMMASEMPLTPIVAGIAGTVGGTFIGNPEIGTVAATALGAYENRKAQYRATFKQVYNELRDQGKPEFDALSQARRQAENAQEIGTIVGGAQGLIGAKIGAIPIKGTNFSLGFQQAIGDFLKKNGSEFGKIALDAVAQGGLAASGEVAKNKLAQAAGIKREIDAGTGDAFWGNVFMSGAIGAALKLGRGMSNVNYKRILSGLVKNVPEETLNTALQEKVASGEITQAAADQALKEINSYKEKDAQIPPNVTEEARFKIQDNIDKINELEKQKDATHSSLQGPIKEKIDKLIEDNLALAKEIEKTPKPESGLTKDQEKEAIDFANELVDEGILPDTYATDIKKDPIKFWKTIAQQAQNRDENWNPLTQPIGEQSVRDNYGDTVVDYAKELFPAPEIKESSISVIQPGEIKHPETITIKPQENAIPIGSTEEVHVGETPGHSQPVGEGIPESGETTGTQEGGTATPKEENPNKGQEGQVEEPGMVGITHSEMDKVSRELGLPEYTQDPETFEGWTREAKDRIAKDPDSINKLINKLRKGESPDPVETQMMKLHFAALKDKYNNNPTPELLAEINRTKDLYNISGRELGKGLVARKGLVPEEDTLADFHMRDVEFNKGAPLTEKQTAQSTKEFNEIKAAKDALEAKVAKMEAGKIKEKAEKKVQQEAKAAKKDAKKDYKTERKQILTDIQDKWKKSSKESLGASVLPYAKELAAIAPDVMKLVANVIGEGIEKLPDILKAVHGQIKELIPEITEKDVHDIIAGEYSEKKPPRNKLATQLFDVRTEARLINELEQLLNGEIPKNEKKKRQRNQKIEALRTQIKGLKDELGLNERSEAEKLASLKGRYSTKIKELEEKIAKGDYGPDEKPEPIKLDKEAQDLRDELLKLKDERAIRLLKQQYANRTTGEKAIAAVGKGLRTGRQIQSGFFDVSYPFRQTIVGVARQLLALPFKRENGKIVYTGFKSQRELGQQFGKMYKAFGSEKQYRRTMADIKEHPRFDVAKESKLDIAELDTPLERFKEEEAQTSYAEKIPVAKQGVRMSNRAATVIANKMKFDIFNQLVDGFEQAGKTFKNSPELYKEAAKYANQLVGRGFLGEKLEMASPLIGHVLYSLRLQASRLQLLTNLINPRFYAKVPKEIRIEYFKDMTKFVLMGTAMLGLAKSAGLGVELDPRSSDFGSIVWGDTRYDIWGGFKQYVTLFSRLLTASTKSPETGQINRLKIPFSAGTPEYREKTYGDLLLRFARTKASPEAGTFTDILVGETFDKKAVTARGESVGYIAPLIIGDVYDAWKDNGVAGAALTYILSTHGIGTQVHIKEGGFDDLISGETESEDSGSAVKKGKPTKPSKPHKTKR